MKWMGIFQVRIFWVANFRVWGNFPGGTSMVIFRVGILPGQIFLEPFSLHNVSIFIFEKIIKNKRNTFNKNIYTLNS